MSCCGRKRALLYGATPARNTNVQAAPATPSRTAPVPSAIFEYQGDTAVSAVGAVTRKLYRFDGKRAQLAIDARDAPSMTAAPNLRRIR